MLKEGYTRRLSRCSTARGSSTRLFRRGLARLRLISRNNKTIRYVKIQTFDNQTPVFYLAIGQKSKDLKYLIPRTGSLGLQGKHKLTQRQKEVHTDRKTQ